MLIRVPEAYLLLRPFDTTRPALLVLDADGRRVASVRLDQEADATAVALRLTQARDETASERWLVQVEDLEQAETVVQGLGEHVAGATVASLPGGFVEVRAAPGAVTPARLAAAARGATLRIVDPVPVTLTGGGAAAVAGAQARAIAGVHHVRTTAEGTTAWICRWLLHPRHLAARRLAGDVTAVTYRFEDLPKGGTVVPHLMRPFTEPGVLAVVPHVEDGAIEVIGRRGAHDAARTHQAFVAAGLHPLP